MNSAKQIKITYSNVNEDYRVYTRDTTLGEDWKLFDNYSPAIVPSGDSYTVDDDAVKAEILPDIMRLVMEGYCFIDAVIEQED